MDTITYLREIAQTCTRLAPYMPASGNLTRA
jgi:hypothetical protein